MILSVASPKAQEVELNELKEKLKIILTENDLKQKELINKLNKSETDYNNLLERTNKQISDLNANLEVKIFIVNSLTSKNQEFWLAYSKKKKLNDELMVKISKLNLIFRQNNEDFKNEKYYHF
jgi:hypothetical protein